MATGGPTLRRWQGRAAAETPSRLFRSYLLYQSDDLMRSQTELSGLSNNARSEALPLQLQRHQVRPRRQRRRRRHHPDDAAGDSTSHMETASGSTAHPSSPPGTGAATPTSSATRSSRKPDDVVRLWSSASTVRDARRIGSAHASIASAGNTTTEPSRPCSISITTSAWLPTESRPLLRALSRGTRR